VIGRLLPEASWARAFLVRWVAITGCGSASTVLLHAAFEAVPGYDAEATGWSLATMLAGFGALGFADWLVLRHHVPGAARWVPATVGGGCCGVALGITLLVLAYLPLMGAGYTNEELAGSWAWRLAAAGTTTTGVAAGLGYAQARVLRAAARRPERWIAVTVVTMAALSLVGAAVYEPLFEPLDLLGDALYGAVSGGLYALPTGLVLVRLLADPPDRPLPHLFQRPEARPTLLRDPEFEAAIVGVRHVLLVCFLLLAALMVWALVSSRPA
jgi:hypothetical protein